MTRPLTVRRGRGTPALAALLLLAGLATPHRRAAADYTIVDLNPKGSPFTAGVVMNGTGINATGQATGYSSSLGFFANGQANSMTQVGPLPGGSNSYTLGINNSGVVVGYGSNGSGGYDTFTYDHGTLTDVTATRNVGLAGASYNFGQAINSTGEIAGYSMTPGVGTYAFLFNGTSTIKLGYLPGSSGNSYATALNDSGLVVGYAATAPGPQHAFLYSNGTMKDLGTLGGPASTAYDISSTGLVVGSSNIVIGGSTINHAFYDNGTTMVDLTPISAFGSNSEAFGVNSSGSVVGYFGSFAGGLTHGFLDSNGVFTDLNGLISATSGWTILRGYGINDNGQILALGTNDGGTTTHALMLSAPVMVAEPPTIALLCSGAAVGLGLRRLSRRRIKSEDLAGAALAV